METLSEIHGQARVIEILERALLADRVPQAYLFAGPKGCGKHTTGLALAMALNCLDAPLVGCHTCEACTKIADGNHPDVRVLATEGKQKRIPIDTIRKQVIPALGMPLHEGKARVFLIEEASSMMGPTANALLKTLEEPPPNTHFILGSVSPVQLLPTIRSRCQRINFQALSADLQAQFRGDDEEAAEIRSLCEGMIRVANSRGLSSILDLAKESPDRPILIAALQMFAQNCHKEARHCAESGRLDLALVHSKRAKEVLSTLRALREHNAHGQLALEHLLVAMRGLPTQNRTGTHA